ncbi:MULTISPECIES: helix-turn-helix domain-containing protein [Sporosarcina]|uniref:helix-turn-helix domain-containing protein n=1 Tax=Sporosarcina TaxID=1569 RepID=UPI000C170ACE|nr:MULTISPECIES: helix-turn-helix domain-containing protein [Sporosarcina]PIC57861.1 XRE family transcriptional regulator [Sporosarcina sp. P10]PIC61243.1 XRE family transcriptional regulator [Sporosarcina sp. P12(2017)]PIC77895.1 XRE family transcriptional regulator [Sporosarcina sp. P19]
MDTSKVGEVIYNLRKEKGFTQKQLADQMNISDRTISKWERGYGCPDVTLLSSLSTLLGVNIENILDGELLSNEFIGGNMKKSKYFVCPSCHNIVLATGDITISCCGRKLEALEAKKASEAEKLTIEEVDNEHFISSDHPMTKDHYISFIAFATGDQVQIIKQYPEWSFQTRLPKRKHGTLLWYDTQLGLYYQFI